MSNLTTPIDLFIRELCKKYCEINEIWWLGSRANDINVRNDSDWDFLVFAGKSAFLKIKQNKKLENRAKELIIDLLVEEGDGIFNSVWGTAKKLTLQDLKWQVIAEGKVKYWASKLIEGQPDDTPYKDEWQEYFAAHGADVYSQDVSTWMYAKRIWPSR